jgi:hypothetical protein
MITCKYCQYPNADQAKVCEQCGHHLWGDETWQVPSTIQDETIVQKLPESFSKSQIKAGWGTSTFEPQNYVILHIRETQEPVFVKLQDEYLFGRYEGIDGLNLAPFGGLEKGVSRIHAALRRGDEMLFLVDLGSTNGTFLNEQAISPNQPRVLRSGDQIRLGQMVMHIYFGADTQP